MFAKLLRRAFLLMAFVALIPSMASQPTGTRVIGNTPTATDLFLLEGYTSSAWAEIDYDEYRVTASGYVVKRDADDSDAAPDWSVADYSAYRWSGTLWTNGGAVPINQEPLTFTETALASPLTGDDGLNLDAARRVIAGELYAGDMLKVDEIGVQSESVQLAEILRLGKGQQTKRPRTLENVDNSGGGGAWNNPARARTRDTAYADNRTTGSALEITQVLRATNFGFKIPNNATITDIELVMYGYNDPDSSFINYPVTLTTNSAVRGYFFDTFPFDTLAGTVDSSAEWIDGLSPREVNDSNFGVDIWAETDVFPTYHYINSIALTIYYTTAQTGTTVLDASGDVTLDGAADVSGAVTVSGALTIDGAASFGYVSGSGGAVTQSTDKATGVELNAPCGTITMNNATLNAATTVSFTLTNSTITTSDVLILNHLSAGTAGAYLLNAQCASGSASINVRNITAGNLGEAIVISFAVVRVATA